MRTAQAMVLDAPRRPLVARRSRCASRRPVKSWSKSPPAACAAPTCTFADGELTRPKLPLVLGHEVSAAWSPPAIGVDASARVTGRRAVAWRHLRPAARTAWRRARNLCDAPSSPATRATGRLREPYAADAGYVFALPDAYDDRARRPLLCAG